MSYEHSTIYLGDSVYCSCDVMGSSTVLLPRLGRVTLRITRALKPRYSRCKGGRPALGPTKEILVPGFSKMQAPWLRFTFWSEKGGRLH